MALIPWWIKYPNVNDEIMNLDWLLKVSTDNTEKISNFINLNTIKYADPILWDITSQYEANTITVDPQTGDAYISTKAVPYGVSLSNTDYWTKIYNYADEMNALREQIAAANEELSNTASAPRAIGDLVWLNGQLYKVTAPMIAGDTYIIDSNVVKTTIEDEIKSNITAIQNEVDIRRQADIQLQNNIDKISHIIYTSNYTSFNDILDALGDDDILCLNSVVDITDVTGVINAKIIQTVEGEFSGSPTNLIINNQTILPAWFGIKKADSTFNNAPAIQKAINSCAVGSRVYLEKGEYYVSSQITINKVITFEGDRDGTTITCGLNDVSPLITISGTTTTYVDGVTIKNLVLGKYTQNNNSIGLFVTLASNTLIQNIRSANFVNCFKFKFTTSTRVEGCIALNALEQAFYGYLLDCTEYSPIRGLSSNGSFYLNNCSCNAAENSNITTGFYVTGKDMRDIFLNGFESANCNYGININGDSTVYATDILITNCVLDRCKNIGIRISNLPNRQAGVKVSNTFISIDESQSVEHCIRIDNSKNVTIDNCELYCLGASFSAIALINAQRCSINNVAFNSPAYAIVVDSSSKYNIISNIIIQRQDSYENAILIQGGYNLINNVMIQASYNIGINISGNHNILLGYISIGNTTNYSDTGSSNQINYVS